MKRIERGPVKGISLKLQEEERERRMDFIPERSVLDVDKIEVDADTRDMLRSLEFADIQGVSTQSASAFQRKAYQGNRGPRLGDRKKD
jgi:small subunit ribosomal protein S17e